jgi:hypothetical protein
MAKKRTARDLAKLLPSVLVELDRWIPWSLSQTKGGKPTKKPDGSILDPANRFPFLALADAVVNKNRGIGFVFTGGVLIRGHRLLSFDIDACRDPATGAISPWAQGIVDHYHTFTEITPSGTGLRLWLLVKNPPESLPVIKIPHPAPSGVDKKPEIQVFGFGSAQYVTTTGDKLHKCSTIKRIKELDWFVEEFGVSSLETSIIDTELPHGSGTAPTLDEIDAVVQRDPQGKMLVEGDWENVGVESASEGWWRLGQIVCRAAKNHGSAAVDYLLGRTAYGAGAVDSKDPDRYTRRSWVERDLSRIVGKTIDSSGSAFRDGFDAAAWQPPRRPKQGSRVLQAADFDAECGPTECLVYNLLPARGLGQIFGEPSCGKTPFALSLAMHVALGKDWFGSEMERPGAAVYMVGEDMTGIRDRMNGELKALSPGTKLQDIPFYLTKEPGRLIDHDDAKRWVEEIREITQQRTDSVSLLVVDTQNRNFGPGNENSTEDMTKFVDGCDMIRRELDCCVLCVHHVGLHDKDRGRGSSVMYGALDVVFEVQRENMAVVLLPHKHKNWAAPKPLRGTLVVVDIDTDMKGRPITAITLSERTQSSAFIDMTDQHLKLIVTCIQLAAGDALTQQDICSACGLTRKQLRTKLKNLVDAGMVKVTGGRGGSKSVYTITDFGVASFFPEQDAEQAEIDELLS